MKKDEIDLREYAEIFKRRWKIIAAFALSVMFGAFLYSVRQVPVYEARATILFRGNPGGVLMSVGPIIQGIEEPSKGVMADVVAVMNSRAVAAKVIEDLKLRERIKGWDDPSISIEKLSASLSGMIKKPKGSGNLLELIVEDTDPQRAAEITNSYIDALSYYWNRLNLTEARKKKEYIESQLPRVQKELRQAEEEYKQFTLLAPGASGIDVDRLGRELDIKKDTFSMLKKEYETVKLDESKEIPPFSVIDRAVVPERPVRPNVKATTFTGLAFGLVFGTALAFAMDYFRKMGSNG